MKRIGQLISFVSLLNVVISTGNRQVSKLVCIDDEIRLQCSSTEAVVLYNLVHLSQTSETDDSQCRRVGRECSESRQSNDCVNKSDCVVDVIPIQFSNCTQPRSSTGAYAIYGCVPNKRQPKIPEIVFCRDVGDIRNESGFLLSPHFLEKSSENQQKSYNACSLNLSIPKSKHLYLWSIVLDLPEDSKNVQKPSAGAHLIVHSKRFSGRNYPSRLIWDMANTDRMMEKHTITYVSGEKLTGDGVFLYFELRNISDAIQSEPRDNDIPIFEPDLPKDQEHDHSKEEKEHGSSMSGDVHSSISRDITAGPTRDDTMAATTKRVVDIDGGDKEVDVKYEIAPSHKELCDNHSCSSPHECQLVEGTPKCVCPPTSKECVAANHDPVCASDGVTYSNECVMSALACVHNLQVTVVHKGRCDHSMAARNTLIVHAIYVAAIAVIIIIFVIIVFVICRRQRGNKAQTVYANPFYDQTKPNDKSLIQNGQGMAEDPESARPLMPVPSSPPPAPSSAVSQTRAPSGETAQRTPLLSPIDEKGSNSPRYADEDDDDSIATRSERSSLLDRRDDRTKSSASGKDPFKTPDSRNSDHSSVLGRKGEQSVSKMSLTLSEATTQRPSESGDSNMDDFEVERAPRRRTYSDTESEKSSY